MIVSVVDERDLWPNIPVWMVMEVETV